MGMGCSRVMCHDAFVLSGQIIHWVWVAVQILSHDGGVVTPSNTLQK